MLGARLPDQESAGQQQEAGGSAGEETQQGNPLSQRRFGTRLMSVIGAFLSTIEEAAGQPMPQKRPGAPGRRLRLERRSSRRSRARRAPQVPSAGAPCAADRHLAISAIFCGAVAAMPRRATSTQRTSARRLQMISHRARRANAQPIRTASAPCAVIQRMRLGIGIAQQHRPSPLPARASSRPLDARAAAARRHGRKPRLGRNLALVEFLQPLAPPGELDRAERRLRAIARRRRPSRSSISNSASNAGAQLGRPIEPDEVAIARSQR